jgi:hypothetical protein
MRLSGVNTEMNKFIYIRKSTRYMIEFDSGLGAKLVERSSMVSSMESMTWAGATPVPGQATQHRTLYSIAIQRSSFEFGRVLLGRSMGEALYQATQH